MPLTRSQERAATHPDDEIFEQSIDQDPPPRRDTGAAAANVTGADTTFTPESVASLIASLQKSQTDAFKEIFQSMMHSRTSTPNPNSDSGYHGTMARCKATFSGAADQSVEAFIDAVESYTECAQVTDSNVVKGLSLLLVSQAGTWWQGVKNQISTWAEAKSNLISAFGDRRPPHRIYKEIFSKPQALEKTDIFVARIRALMARLPEGDITVKAQLDMVYGLLHVRIRERLRREEFCTFMELLTHARNIEDSLFETEKKHETKTSFERTNRMPPPSVARSNVNSGPRERNELRDTTVPSAPRSRAVPVTSNPVRSESERASDNKSDNVLNKKQHLNCSFCKRVGHSREFCRKLASLGSRWWLALLLQTLLLAAGSGKHHHHHRRSMPTQATLPVSKSGWRPVLGSGGVLYGSFAGAHQNPSYKIPVPVLDLYHSSARPLVARDATKLTSIAQSYRPTTIRTVSSAPPAPPANQPISSYHNPFALPNNGYTYKYIQNYPLDSVLFRNPQNPYAARPVFSKYPPKIKQSYHNTMLQQLTNIQPIHFGQYQTGKPLDIFGKPVEGYARPTESSKQSNGLEVFKPEVFKLPDSDTASQSINQQVKTAQQQSFVVTPKSPLNAYSHYSFQDTGFPPSILGTFGSFGVQSVKGRDPVFSTTKTTYLPPQPTKQTIFNSFSFSPSYKTTAGVLSTTPKLQTTLNHITFGSTFNDFKAPTQQTKVSAPVKIDPNAPTKGTFKPSPQDPFINKHFHTDHNKVVVTTYNPVQATTLASNFFDFGFPSQQSAPVQNYNHYEKKKQKIHDSFAAGVNQVPQHYTSPPKVDINSVSSRPTYEVIETTDSGPADIITHSSPPAWTYQSYDGIKSTEQSVTKQYLDSFFGNPTTTAVPELPEEYAIVTEAEKGYENSLNYDGQVESQSRRPLGDDFEPIGKHKLKDYYYKVSTNSYDDHTTAKRTKKPTEAPKIEVTTTHFDITNDRNNEKPTEALPTLPPNQHFKRPSSQEPLDKDRIRKRNKHRRRRPPLANISNSTTTTTRKYYHTTTETPFLPTTEPEEIHTIRPRVRPFKLKGQPNLTTPSITTDLTTSALPTISPTIPTLVKKKLVRRPQTTTTERFETTTQVYRDSEASNDSPIMKIANRPSYSKFSQAYEYRSEETPDYSHKQDEKDTPTSDIAVNLSETTAHAEQDQAPTFAFHKDVKPIEAKLETTTDSFRATEPPSEASTTPGRVQRPRLKNKFNRPKFSVKDYRNRLNATTSTTEKTTESTTKVRFPQRRVPSTDNYFNSDIEVTTERRKFMPKDPRHKSGNYSENSEQVEKEIHTSRPFRNRITAETTETVTQKISSRIRNGQRRPKPTEETTETTNATTVHSKRPLRKKIKDSSGEETQEIAVTETTVHYDHKNDITSERTRSESAIMKIADKKHQDHHLEHIFEHSKRVSDLTLAASKDYNTPGMFKTVSSNSRRIPNYFTIATDDPILPIEAFFPQLNQKKES